MAWTQNLWSQITLDEDSHHMPFSGSIAANTVICVPVRFETTGTVSFYSNNSGDLIGYISTSDILNEDTGAPADSVRENDDNSDFGERNFGITDFRITMSPCVYYFWWREYGGSSVDSFNVVISIDDSGGGGGGGSSEEWTDEFSSLGYLDENYGDRVYVSGTTYKVYRAKFYDSGEVIFSSTGSVNVAGYVTTTGDAYDTITGNISNYIVGGSRNGEISLSFNASAGTSYYFWIRVVDPQDSGYTRFSIEVPSSGTGTGDWDIEDWGGSRIISPGSSISFGRGEPDAYYLSCIPLNFGQDGNYTISASTSTQLFAYLTTSKSIDRQSGEPYSGIVGSDTSSSDGFSMDVSVETGVTYYLIVRTSDGSRNEQAFNVIFSDNGGGGGGSGGWLIKTGTFGTVSSILQERVTINSSTICRYLVSFQTSGVVDFYSTGDFDTIGYISFTGENAYDDTSGEPLQYQVRDDDAGDNHNFKIQYSVDANTSYLFWFRFYNSATTGTVTICIQPPGGSTSAWTLDDFSYGTVRERINAYASLDAPKTLAHRSMSFATYGVVTVYTTGNYNTIGYLSESDQWNQDTGTPKNPIQFSDSGGAGYNFRFTFTAYENTTYHIWYRTLDGSSAGEFYFVVEPPGSSAWVMDQFDVGVIGTSEYTKSDNIGARHTWRFSFRPQSSGEFEMYTTGSLDTYGYLGTTSGFNDNDGTPTSFIAENDDGGSDRNCYIKAQLTAGVTYYFWVKPYSESGSGNPTIIIKPPIVSSRKGFWILTENGENGWKKVTPYILKATSNGETRWVKIAPCIFNGTQWINGT